MEFTDQELYYLMCLVERGFSDEDEEAEFVEGSGKVFGRVHKEWIKRGSKAF